MLCLAWAPRFLLACEINAYLLRKGLQDILSWGPTPSFSLLNSASGISQPIGGDTGRV